MSDPRRIEQEAAIWLARSEEPGWSEESRAELQDWLEQSMAHKAAFWRLEHAWRAADRLRSLGRGEPTGQMFGLGNWARWRGPAIGAAVAACLGVAAVVGLHGLGEQPVTPISPPSFAASSGKYETARGMQRRLSLPDGSKVQLNTATQVRTVISPRSRKVWLDSGEVYFEIAHSDDVPFVVNAGPKKVTVLGTKFSVRRLGDEVTVAVIEGRVRIEDTKPPPHDHAVVITAGDVAITRETSTLLTRKTAKQVEGALAWREGFLEFDQTTLAAAAAQFNRYNRLQIEITDPETAQIRIGGRFQVNSGESFARLLGDSYGLKVKKDGDRIRISGE